MGGIDVFCIAAGAIISSGLFILPGLVYAKVGPAVILAYILAGVLVLPALFAKTELATAMPRAGGSYFFIERSMGSAAGTIGGFILLSILWHKIYVRGKAIRKAALIHIVERVTAKEIAGDSLGAELRKMLRERDEIVEDRFDRLVKECEIIDTGKPTTLIDFFTIAAEKLAKRLNTDARQLLDSFIAREKDTTTAIRPGLAIPHITVDGEHKFELVVARCEAGINFTQDLPPVYAAFILAGSCDERNFHLRALSAIAQITQDVDFDKNWLRAKNIEELRDIMLLARRHRETV